MGRPGRPVKHHTPEAKREAQRAAWRKYSEGHREERCEANREYVRRPLVKARIHEMRKIRMARAVDPVAVVSSSAFKMDRPISPLEKRETPECPLPELDKRRVFPPLGLGTEERCQPTTQ